MTTTRQGELTARVLGRLHIRGRATAVEIADDLDESKDKVSTTVRRLVATGFVAGEGGYRHIYRLTASGESFRTALVRALDGFTNGSKQGRGRAAVNDASSEPAGSVGSRTR